MRFERAKESIAALENAKEITIYDALNIFYDLCEDLRRENGAIDKLPVGDEAGMVRRMCWTGRTLLKIAREHPDYIEKSAKSQNLERTCAEVLQEDQRIEQHFQTLSRQLEECQQAYEAKQYRENAIHMQMEGLRTEGDALDQQIGEKEAAYVAMNQAFEGQKALYNQLIAQMQKLDSEHKKLVADTNALDEKLKIVNVEELRNIYNNKTRELEALQKDCAALEEQVRLQSEAAERLKAELAQRSKFLQEQAWSIESEKQKAQAEANALDERIARAVQDRKTLVNNLALREKEIKDLEAWFNSLEAHNYAVRLQKSSQRAAELKASQEALSRELEILGAIANARADDNLLAYQQYFRDAMEHIEQTLDDYQKNYLIVTEAFEQGGSCL